MHKKLSKYNRAMTLIELLIVVGLLSMVAKLSLDFMLNSELKYEKKKANQTLHAIKQSIINSDIEISDFVQDMGRLPRNINELCMKHNFEYYINNTTQKISFGPYLNLPAIEQSKYSLKFDKRVNASGSIDCVICRNQYKIEIRNNDWNVNILSWEIVIHNHRKNTINLNDYVIYIAKPFVTKDDIEKNFFEISNMTIDSKRKALIPINKFIKVPMGIRKVYLFKKVDLENMELNMFGEPIRIKAVDQTKIKFSRKNANKEINFHIY